MSGVTNMLLECAIKAEIGDNQGYEMIIDNIRQKHFDVLNTIFDTNHNQIIEDEINILLSELNSICYSISIMGEVTPRGLDVIVSLGERMNARVFSAILRDKGILSQPIEATKLIVTNNIFQNASPLMDESEIKIKKELQPLLKNGIVPVVTGFIGATKDGKLTTLGRGGSDYSASILGACIDAKEVWTWTDVDGVMSADPRVVSNTIVIPELSFIEVGEMAYFGAKVLHPKTIMPIMDKNIPLYVKNTFNSHHPGTKIIKNVSKKTGKATAVSVIKNLSIITIAGKGMMGVTGIAARTFATVARTKSSIVMISQSSSEQSICFVIPEEKAKIVSQELTTEFQRELERDDISAIIERNCVSVVSVIGEGMRETPGVAGEIFTALGENNINVILITQGSSEYSISFAVESEQANLAMQKIHQKIIENHQNPSGEKNE
jgi:aspartate kinase